MNSYSLRSCIVSNGCKRFFTILMDLALFYPILTLELLCMISWRFFKSLIRYWFQSTPKFVLSDLPLLSVLKLGNLRFEGCVALKYQHIVLRLCNSKNFFVFQNELKI